MASRWNCVWRHWFGALCILGASLGLPGLAPANLTVEDLTGAAITGVGPYYQDVEDAIKKFAARDFGSAYQSLQSAKKSTPGLAPAEVMMARLYFDGNNPSGGIAMLETAIRGTPDDPEAFLMLAERAASEGRITESEFMFQRASTVLDKFADNPRRKQTMLGRLYAGWAGLDEAHGRWDEARTKLEELTKVDPSNGVAHHKLGQVLFRLGDQKRAYSEFQSAAETDDSLPSAELAMAALTQDKSKSEQWLNVAIKNRGNDLKTRLGAAQFMLANNRIPEAKEHADVALKLDPNGLETNLTVGIIARMLSDYQTAEDHLSKAHLLAPNNAAVTNHLALVLLEMPDEASRQRALQFAEMNVNNNPSSPDLLAALGWINYRMNRRAEAQRAFNGAIASSPSGQMNADMGFYMAHLAVERGRIAEAMRILKEALNNNQPFVYRKKAEELLAHLVQVEKDQAAKATPASTGGTEK